MPLDTIFWNQEAQRLQGELSPIWFRSFLGGLEEGFEEVLGADFKEVVNWNLVSKQALEFVDAYTFELVKEITSNTQAIIQTELMEWIESGEHLDVLLDNLNGTGVWGRTRADAIGITETTRAYTEGNLLSWLNSGVVTGKAWATANDEFVCVICEPLDGKTVKLSDGTFPGLTEDVAGPPAHIRCRCYLRPIVVN